MPKLISCPYCGHTRSWVVRRHHRKCKRCRREWSSGTHFFVPRCRLTTHEWKQIIDRFLLVGTIKSVCYDCRIAYGTAQKAVHLVRTVMSADLPVYFQGVCEVDETYIGGAWKNKAIHIRRQGSLRGRGTQKQPIFGIISRQTGQVRTWLTPNTKLVTIFPIIKRHIIHGSPIYTDGNHIYRLLPQYGFPHQWVDHQSGEYVRGDVHTQTIDGYWGLLKTHLDSIGGIRKHHAFLYVGEHQWRYNFRHLNRLEQVERIIVLLKYIGGRF